MLRIIGMLLSLSLLVSCSSQPTTEDTAHNCSSGECVKNLNKLATPETTPAPAPVKSKSSKKKAH